MNPTSRHQCLIYSGAPSHKLTTLAEVMLQMSAQGYRCLYLNSPAMVAGLRSSIAAMGVDLELASADRSLIFSSDPVCAGDDFNVKEMLEKLEASLDEALNDGFKGLWASGDMTWEFGAEKNFDKLIEYEFELEGLFKRRKELSGICQYHVDTLPVKVIRTGFLMHKSIFINQTLSRLNPHYTNSKKQPDLRQIDSLSDSDISNLTRQRD